MYKFVINKMKELVMVLDLMDLLMEIVLKLKFLHKVFIIFKLTKNQ